MFYFKRTAASINNEQVFKDINQIRKKYIKKDDPDYQAQIDKINTEEIEGIENIRKYDLKSREITFHHLILKFSRPFLYYLLGWNDKPYTQKDLFNK